MTTELTVKDQTKMKDSPAVETSDGHLFVDGEESRDNEKFLRIKKAVEAFEHRMLEFSIVAGFLVYITLIVLEDTSIVFLVLIGFYILVAVLFYIEDKGGL